MHVIVNKDHREAPLNSVEAFLDDFRTINLDLGPKSRFSAPGPRMSCRASLEKLVRSNLHGEIQRTVLLIYDERRAARRAAKNGDFISHY